MLSLQNAKGSRNHVLAVRCAVIILLCGALLMISAIQPTKAGAQDQSSAAKFRRVGNSIPNQYIVVLNDNIPGSEVASRAAEMTVAAQGSVGHIYRYALRGFSARMSETAAMALSQDSRVEFIEEDATSSLGTTQTITYPGGPWGLDRIDQSDLPVSGSYSYVQTGIGTNAYILDTGVRTTHQEFGSRAFVGADFVGDGLNGADCTTGVFPNGHGTLVSGIVGGTTYGVAKGATLWSVRVCDCFGSCANSNMVAGIDWITGNHIKPAVANVSIQKQGGVTSVDKAVRRSIAAGVTYVVIAGNFNEDASNTSPARVTQAITVGATGDDQSQQFISDTRASFSNFGSVLDLFAPGVQIPSASAASDTSTTADNGTSFSGPHVTGATALYVQADSTACPSTVSDVIINNATSGRVTNPGSGSPNKLLFTPQSWPAPSYYSLLLNGTNAYVDVPNAGLGVSLDVTGPVTIEAWVKLNTNTTRQAIVERYNPSAGSGTSDGGYGLRLMPTGKVRFYSFKNSVDYSFVTGNTVLSTGVWYHIAGVFDGGQLKIFVQGISDATPVPATYSNQGGTSNLKIGISPEGSYFLNGRLDEVRVTANAVYTTTFTPQHKLTGLMDTKGLWRFDRQNARDCADINNGTVAGGAIFSTDVP